MGKYRVNDNYKQIQDERLEGYYGQWNTDKVIEQYFLNRKPGIAVDVGAADGVRGSNTYFFEKLGWDVICVEPNPKFYPKLAEVRKRVYEYALTDFDGASEFTVFNVGAKEIMSSLSSLKPDQRLVRDHEHIINSSEKIIVNTTTLTNLLYSFDKNLEWIDFISIDTEGTELDVLKGLDFNRYKVKLFVIENNYEDESIEQFMKSKGYIKDQRYKINDFYKKEL